MMKSLSPLASIGFVSPGSAPRDSALAGRVGSGSAFFLRIPTPDSRLPSFQVPRFPFSSFEFPLSSAILESPQFSNRGEKTSEFFRPNKTYPQHNKGPVAEYFVCPKMAHPIENTGDADCISFKGCRFNRLTHGCLESLQSANLTIANTDPSSLHLRLQALSPVCLRQSRSTSPKSRSFWRIPSSPRIIGNLRADVKKNI